MRTITRSAAEDIAARFIAAANPCSWDGKGDKPVEVNTKIVTYDYGSAHNELDISIEKDDGEWCHYCELRDKETGELLACCHGYGVDSPMNLADSIEEVCNA